MVTYYNEFDPKAAAWLRELIAQGHLPPGDVDERDIRDIEPRNLDGYTQCHFFAGIGGWSLALRYAGWPDDRPVWTGSCPCQPFSAAGRRGRTSDERHLWPHWNHLIGECLPPVVFGEQVASKDGLGWLDLVQADLEASGYAVGAADMCAAGFGAPHIRQRLWFGAYDLGSDGGLAHGERNGQHWRRGARSAGWEEPSNSDDAERMAHGALTGRRQVGDVRQSRERTVSGDIDTGWPRPTDQFWRDADWLYCRDGKWRPVEPGTFSLAHGVSGRVGLLRGYGNAIVPQVAAEFIQAFEEYS